MKRFARDQLERFLRALDAHLEGSTRLMIIGGSALAIGYDVGSVTNDIDTYESDVASIQAAVETVRSETGLEIPVANSSVAQLPEGAESRCRRVLDDLVHLEVYVADAHDLAASKLLRGNEHDRDQLRELHALHPLSLELLVERYVGLLSDYVGDSTEPRWSLVHFIDEVWGELAGVDARRSLGVT